MLANVRIWSPLSACPCCTNIQPYVSFISGGGYSITPDEGTSSSSVISIEIQDTDDYITDMLANAQGNLQKKNCTIKMGYLGMDEADMIQIFSGEVTNYDYNDDGSWTIKVSDAIRDLNKYLFRTATEAVPNTLQGNPLTLILALLMSDQGDYTNGQYDYLPAGMGLGISEDKINVEHFEFIRETYYPTTSVTFRFSVDARQQANDFFKQEFYKPLNMYPVVNGDGKYSATIYRTPMPPFSPVHISEEDTIGIPKYSGNLSSMINEVEFSYNFEDLASTDYEYIDVYVEANSINDRGVGDRTLEIKSKGLHTDTTDAANFVERSSNRIFNRYAVPPIKLSFSMELKYMTAEAGDILFISNKFLPNLVSGQFDFEYIPMEIIKRVVDWRRGSVALTFLQTGYQNLDYAAISPTLIITSGISATQFVVADINDWKVGFIGTLYSYRNKSVTYATDYMDIEVNDVEVLDINEVTKTITVTNMGMTPLADWRFSYNDTGTNLNDEQEFWGRISNDYYITP